MSWAVEWAAEKASAALRYLADFYPECATSEALHPFHDAAHQAAVAGDKEAYLEALRGYMKAGRRVALEARGRAA
jgi:RecB family exonuclease